MTELKDEKYSLKGQKNKTYRNNKILQIIEEIEKAGAIKEKTLDEKKESYSKINYKERLFKCKESKLIR
jgi:hypothetical protein